MSEASNRPLQGKVALVTGAAGTMGLAATRALLDDGCTVALVDSHHERTLAIAESLGRNGDKAEALAASLRAAGHDALALAMDAHSVAATQEAVDAAARHFGRLDILMNCIGIQREQSLLEVTEEAFDEVTQVNLKAAMFLAQAAARHQIAGGRGGAQVHLLSVRSRFGLRGRGYSAYASTKGALVMLIRQHAAELAPHGITVNGIAPTVVRTGMARHWLDNPATHEQLLARIPLGRVAEPADIAGTAVYFCAPAAAYVTGQVLYLDGGITATQSPRRRRPCRGPRPFLESTGSRRFRLIRKSPPIARKPAWGLVNKLIRIRREPKNSLFP